MRRRSPARWLAPIALIACAFAIYTVVDKGLLQDDGGAKTTTSKTSTSGKGASTTKKKTAKKAKTYTVKSGDTFSAIADKEGVEVEALQEANPKVDASALHPGQKLKLPR
ncbi:MAG TPA: LysM domain-containing protein [Baekduia sp.]|uniref:LysM peptidoglycan-binding domain-containing protein n=1 Tax=Baekduia sp. TaxID=2600305 RepID=UPI002D776EE5|nr:LysM domain-containing protein [Baekduia sp.]HET6507695.1 LysM domain-containing protein [Baekduia sp.]